MFDSDSDSDFLSPNNVYAAPDESTIVRAKGPNFNGTVKLNFDVNSMMQRYRGGQSFRDNNGEPSMYERRETSPISMKSVPAMPLKNQRSTYRDMYSEKSMMTGRPTSPMSIQSIGQRNLFKRRETSPLSMRSIPVIPPRNYPHSSYGYSQNSMVIGRGVSPMSMRSIARHNIYGQREKSPMSLRSIPVMPSRNYSHSLYHSVYSQNPTMTERPTSPMSVRSIGSNVCSDIISAFKSMKFNKYELRNIEHAFNKYQKRRIGKKIARRKNLKLFLNSARRKSSNGSEDLSSDSSLSNDCRSTRTAKPRQTSYHKYMNSFKRYTQNGRVSDDSRSCKTDIRNIMRDNTVMKDCTNNFKQSSFRNLLSLGPKNMDSAVCDMTQNTITEKQTQNTITEKQTQNTITEKQTRKEIFNSFLLPSQRFNKSSTGQPTHCNDSKLPEKKTNSDSLNNNTISNISQNNFVQKRLQTERFKSGFLLPSQRFNKSCAGPPILEECCDNKSPDKESNCLNIKENELLQNTANYITTLHKNADNINQQCSTLDINQSNKTKLSNVESNRKRTFESSDDYSDIENKADKPTPPKENTKIKKGPKNGKQTKNSSKDDKCPDFNFAKPQFPIRKSRNSKQQQNSISSNVENLDEFSKNKETYLEEQLIARSQDEDIEKHSESINSNTSDLSQRPSFIKRKLFTQTLDVTENRAVNLDNSPSISPQPTGYCNVTKEKHKARKLVTNQSCLSRDINNDDDNLLDLIHKIVPLNHMNVTTSTKQKLDNKKNKESANKSINTRTSEQGKFDITSIISTCNNGDGSDTYTDEEIFKVHNTLPKRITLSEPAIRLVRVDEEKFSKIKKGEKVTSENKESLKLEVVQQKTPVKKKGEINKNIVSFAHAFWNCDSESETRDTPRKNIVSKESIKDFMESQTDITKCLSSNRKTELETNKRLQSSRSVPDINQNDTSNHQLGQFKNSAAGKSKVVNNSKRIKLDISNDNLTDSIINNLRSRRNLNSSSLLSDNSSPPTKNFNKNSKKINSKQAKKLTTESNEEKDYVVNNNTNKKPVAKAEVKVQQRLSKAQLNTKVRLTKFNNEPSNKVAKKINGLKTLKLKTLHESLDKSDILNSSHTESVIDNLRSRKKIDTSLLLSDNCSPLESNMTTRINKGINKAVEISNVNNVISRTKNTTDSLKDKLPSPQNGNPVKNANLFKIKDDTLSTKKTKKTKVLKSSKKINMKESPVNVPIRNLRPRSNLSSSSIMSENTPPTKKQQMKEKKDNEIHKWNSCKKGVFDSVNQNTLTLSSNKRQIESNCKRDNLNLSQRGRVIKYRVHS